MFPEAADRPAVGSAAMVPGQEEATAYCASYQQAVEVIGRRWTGEIIRALLAGKTRFSEFTAIIPGLSDRLLSERMKELEAEGIVSRCVSPDTPVRVDYRLTDKGEDLLAVVDALEVWANRWIAGDGG
jgi:DNA-binding HxlR family transcriptional regulator